MKNFASSGDLEEKKETIELLAEGVYALTAEGDPNVGAIEADDFLIAFDARATPASAQEWLKKLRKHTSKPVRYLVLSHYHAVRTLGASALNAHSIIAHTNTRLLIEERGKEDWKSEYGRMPRLFKEPDTIPGLTHPDMTFDTVLQIPLGKNRGDLELHYCGRGHTAGDIIAWLPKQKILFAGDLVEAKAALYTGDAFHFDWAHATLDKVQSFGAEKLVGGRGAVAIGVDAVNTSIEQTRFFLNGLMQKVEAVHNNQGSLKQAFSEARQYLEPKFGKWPIFEHCLPFDVARFWDELNGIDWPQIWTAERDHEIWGLLHDNQA